MPPKHVGLAGGVHDAHVDRRPLVGVLRCVLDAQRPRVAERDGHGAVGRLRVDPRLAVAVPLALEGRHGIVGPDRAHGGDAFAHRAVATAERHVGAMVGELLGVPAHAHAQHDASAAQHIGAGDGASEVDEVVLEDEADTRAQRDLTCLRGGDADGHEGVHHVEVGARQLAAVGVRALAGCRNVGVLGVPHRCEAAFLELPGQVAWIDAAVVIAGQVAEFHGAQPRAQQANEVGIFHISSMLISARQVRL